MENSFETVRTIFGRAGDSQATCVLFVRDRCTFWIMTTQRLPLRTCWISAGRALESTGQKSGFFFLNAGITKETFHARARAAWVFGWCRWCWRWWWCCFRTLAYRQDLARGHPPGTYLAIASKRINEMQMDLKMAMR